MAQDINPRLPAVPLTRDASLLSLSPRLRLMETRRILPSQGKQSPKVPFGRCKPIKT